MAMASRTRDTEVVLCGQILIGHSCRLLVYATSTGPHRHLPAEPIPLDIYSAREM